jgi:hypothetical protein
MVDILNLALPYFGLIFIVMWLMQTGLAGASLKPVDEI